MNVIAIARKYRFAAKKTARNRQRNLKEGKPKGHDRNRDSDHGRRFFRTGQRQGSEHESDKHAAGVAQKDRSGMKVKSQKAQDDAGKHNRKQCDRGVMHKKRSDEHDECGEERRSSRSSVKP